MVAAQLQAVFQHNSWCFVVSNIGIVTDCKLFSLLSAVMPPSWGGRQTAITRMTKKNLFEICPSCHFSLS